MEFETGSGYLGIATGYPVPEPGNAANHLVQIRCGPIWSDAVRCSRMYSDAVISHTAAYYSGRNLKYTHIHENMAPPSRPLFQDIAHRTHKTVDLFEQPLPQSSCL